MIKLIIVRIVYVIYECLNDLSYCSAYLLIVLQCTVSATERSFTSESSILLNYFFLAGQNDLHAY